MSENDFDHLYCRFCGKKMLFRNSEKDTVRHLTLLFYACPDATLTNSKHDRAVYEIEDMHD
jgi:hypothetical protein